MPRRLHNINWTEGMYLAPHHFQAQARFFEDSVQFTRDCFWPYGYGYLALDIDVNELSQGNFAVHHMRGVMRDGTSFDISTPEDLPQREIGTDFPMGGTLVLELALAKRREKERNVGLAGTDGWAKCRFREAKIEVPDVNNAVDREEVGFLKPNFRLVRAGEGGPDDTSIPIARIKRDGDGRYICDPEFAPPCLRVATSSLLRGYLSNVLEFLVANSQNLAAKRRRSQEKAEGRADPKTLAEFWLLHTMNSAIPVFRHWEMGSSPHPAEAFRGLAQLAGALCTFAADGQVDQLPEYNHLAQGECFGQIVEYIRRYAMPSIDDPVVTVRLPKVIQQNSPSDESFFAAAIEDARCFGASMWILQVRAQVSSSLVTQKVPEVALVSSQGFLHRAVSRRLEGVPLRHLPNPPAACPQRFDCVYFAIDTSDDLFEMLQKDRSIGVYLPSMIKAPEVELHVLLGGMKR